jgi:uncharacterized protein YjbI with pentapeptide repeats
MQAMPSPSDIVKNVLARYGRGERNFSRSDLSRQSISDCQFDAIVIAQSNFNESTLSNVTIVLGRLHGSDFQSAVFTRCTFISSQFQGCDFFGATFKECLIAGCYFNESFFGATKFDNCTIMNSALDGSVMFAADFTATNLDGFTFNGVEAATKKQIASMADSGVLPFTESSQQKNSVDSASLINTITMLQVRRQSNADLQTVRFGNGEHYSDYAARRLSTLASIEDFLRQTTMLTDEIERFLHDYKKVADVPSVFISYSFRDTAFVEMLQKHIGALGILVWFAPQKMQGGNTIADQLHEGLREADILILVVSNHSLRSQWVFKEIKEFYRHAQADSRRKFYPIRIDDAPVDDFSVVDERTGHDIANFLRSLSIRDFSHWQDPAKFSMSFDQIANDLGLDTAAASLTPAPTASTAPATRSDSAGHAPELFLCHARDESTLANKIKERLLARGCSVRTSSSGEGVSAAAVLIVLLSSSTPMSPQVARELCQFNSLALADRARRYYVIRTVSDTQIRLRLIDPHNGADIGGHLDALFQRDFSDWRDPAKFALAFDAMANDLGLSAQSFTPGMGRVADTAKREMFLTRGLEVAIMGGKVADAQPPSMKVRSLTDNEKADLIECLLVVASPLMRELPPKSADDFAIFIEGLRDLCAKLAGSKMTKDQTVMALGGVMQRGKTGGDDIKNALKKICGYLGDEQRVSLPLSFMAMLGRSATDTALMLITMYCDNLGLIADQATGRFIVDPAFAARR